MTDQIFKFKMHSTYSQSSFKRNMSTKVSGRKIKETEEESNNGEMDPYMKDIGKIMLHMDMEDLFMQMGMYT